MKRILILAGLVLSLACSERTLKDGKYEFQILSTNDVHGAHFDRFYTGEHTRPSLLAVSTYVDSIRKAHGESNVILLDVGDALQGDNASYYSNFVDTTSEHIFSKMANYLGYDAVVVGNHDIEAGHQVYDKLVGDLNMPYLAANAVSTKTGESYFEDYTILERGGVKIAVLGFTNPNIPAWLTPDLWSGIEFKSLLPMAQELVDYVQEKEKPHVMIVAAHSGTGNGDGKVLENQGMDLLKSLKGVDFLLTAHDHRELAISESGMVLLNGGNRCHYLTQGTISFEVKDGIVGEKSYDAKLIDIDKSKIDEDMKLKFSAEYDAVKAFSTRKIGSLSESIYTKDSFAGQSDYMDLVHAVLLGCSDADISFAAPLSFNKVISEGNLIYNDLFAIYPFENLLTVLKMSGEEVKNYLEYSYDKWLSSDRGILNITKKGNRYSFVHPSFNFDSAAGIDYEVDVTKKFGSRIKITSFADGSDFNMDKMYKVAMTSYRSNGGGDLIRLGAGLSKDEVKTREVATLPQIRDLLYEMILEVDEIDVEALKYKNSLGQWHFVPQSFVEPRLKNDMKLLFGE